MKRHQKNLDDVVWEHVPEKELKDAAYDVWKEVIERVPKVGARNAQATVLAPTGTISYLMDCDTTGIEPGIALKINKKLAGGGEVTLVNQEVPNALNNLGYSESQIKDITEFIDVNNCVISAPHLAQDHYSVFDTAFGNGRGNGQIQFDGHIRMLGAAQPFISGAISKTCNLPEEATVKDIYDAYLLGNELNLKALAVFRNNSKPIAPMNLSERGWVELRRGEKEDLPNQRHAYETEVKIQGTPLHVIVSEYQDGKPGQVTFLAYKSGSTLGALLTTSGVQASRSLKRGIRLDEATEGWLGHEFEPKGLVAGHPFIKTALSPLDFAAKFLRLEYMGDVSMANLPEEDIDVTQLRGAKNGAFRTYDREKVDDWNFEEVMTDPEYGGFKKRSGNPTPKKKGALNNSRGVHCSDCGKAMVQTDRNCYPCTSCGGKIGGCGM